MVVMFGSEIRGGAVAALVDAFAGRNAKFMCLGDYANSRGASDMGLYPDLLPGYLPLSDPGAFAQEYEDLPTQPGRTLPEMITGARDGSIAGLLVVGSNPVARYNIDPFGLEKVFLVVQDLFLTETATLAEVVLPAAHAYEKDGTFTNTAGDLQLLRKAGDRAGVRNDFEIIVRIADRMGADIPRLVPFGPGTRADLGQSRGAQSGEADQHYVWLAKHGLQPKLSPLEPGAVLDEIQRLVPGYDFSRLNLFAGSASHIESVESGKAASARSDLIWPSNDTLFTSGTLGRYSNTLNSVIESRRTEPADKEVVAD
jgi:NADH-quinone oxidoreductase subunit G